MTKKLPKGTLVQWASTHGVQMQGFILGYCPYDGGKEDNAYVVRYIFDKNADAPRHPFTIVDMNAVEPAKKAPEQFLVCGHFGRTPDDRGTQWRIDNVGGRLTVTFMEFSDA